MGLGATFFKPKRKNPFFLISEFKIFPKRFDLGFVKNPKRVTMFQSAFDREHPEVHS